MTYPKPGVPHLAAGSSPNASGQFALDWSGPDLTLNPNLTYTLQGENASGGWETVASGLTSPEYAFAAGSPEGEGTWRYRVQGVDNVLGESTSQSGESTPVVVDESAPNAPTASADRAPEYAGAGGWYKGSVTVSFAANGDPKLSDGSPGSGVNASTLSAPVTFNTTGSHQACGEVADFAGNVSGKGCITVQIDNSAPTLTINCPREVLMDAAPASATVAASDGQSGLSVDPSGSVPIPTRTPGPYTVTRTATDNVGNSTTRSCTTDVVYELAKLAPINGSRHSTGKPLTVKFQLKNALGYVTDASATLELAPASGPEAGIYRPGELDA